MTLYHAKKWLNLSVYLVYFYLGTMSFLTALDLISNVLNKSNNKEAPISELLNKIMIFTVSMVVAVDPQYR